MNKWITLLCAVALIFSTPVYSGKATRAAVLGFIGGYAVGKYTNRPAPQPRYAPRYYRSSSYRAPRYDTSPMAQAFRTQSRFIRKQLQARLKDKGLYRSRIDGAWGPGTRGAFDSFAMSVSKTHLLTTHSGANELMRLLLSEEESEQLAAVDESAQVGTADSVLEESPAQPQQDPEAIKKKLKIADEQLSLLNEVLRNQITDDTSGFAKDKIKAVKTRISVIEAFKGQSVSDAGGKEDKSMMPVAMSGAKAARIYPLIPFYTPGSGQVGELQVAPRGTAKGVVYDFKFVQHVGVTDGASNTIAINSADIEQLNHGIKKSHEWSGVAKEKGLRQLHQKMASCFPENMCGEGGSGAPTKVMFMLYEDGSTAAKIQQKSGNSVTGYNLSVDAALLLSAYLDFMKNKGEAEYSAGTLTDADLNDVFK